MMYPQELRMSLPSNLQAPRTNIFSMPCVLYSNKKLQNLNCIEESSEQFGGLYLGDVISIMKPDIISNYRIQAVLSCMTEFNQPINLPSTIFHYQIGAKDTLEYPIGRHFQQTYNFIEKRREEGKNVLVHCHAGVSRSAAIVCAYMMKKREWTLDQTLSYMRTRRQRVKPNQNFMAILEQFENKIFNFSNSKHQRRNSMGVPDKYPQTPKNQKKYSAPSYLQSAPPSQSYSVIHSTPPPINQYQPSHNFQYVSPHIIHRPSSMISNSSLNQSRISNVNNPYAYQQSTTKNERLFQTAQPKSNSSEYYYISEKTITKTEQKRKNRNGVGLSWSLSDSKAQKVNEDLKNNQNIRISPFDQIYDFQALQKNPQSNKKIKSQEKQKQILKDKICGISVKKSRIPWDKKEQKKQSQATITSQEAVQAKIKGRKKFIWKQHMEVVDEKTCFC